MPETKEELKTHIANLEAQIRDLTEQLAARDAVARSSSESGYLFTTRNPGYNGVVYGVRFSGGRGFLPKGRKDAKKIMLKIVGDFGYECAEINSDQFEAMLDGKPQEKAFLDKVTAPAVLR